MQISKSPGVPLLVPIVQHHEDARPQSKNALNPNRTNHEESRLRTSTTPRHTKDGSDEGKPPSFRLGVLKLLNTPGTPLEQSANFTGHSLNYS